MLCFIPQKKCCLESANRFAVAINISEICRWVKSGQPLSIFYFNVFLFLCLNSIFQFSNRLELVMSFAYHFSRAGAGGNPCSLAAVVYCCTWLYSLLWLGVFLILFSYIVQIWWISIFLLLAHAIWPWPPVHKPFTCFRIFFPLTRVKAGETQMC